MAKRNWLDSTHLRVILEDGSTSCEYDVHSPENPGAETAGTADVTPRPFLSARDLDDLFWGVSRRS